MLMNRLGNLVLLNDFLKEHTTIKIGILER